MKKILLLFLVCALPISTVLAQSVGVSNVGNDLNISDFSGGANFLYVKDNGNIGIGTNSPRLILDINDTTGIIIPAGTTAQRPAAIEGMIRYNTDTKMLEVYNNTNWESLTSIGVLNDTDGDTKIQVENSPDSDTIRFFVKGKEAMFIDTLGYISMGADSAYVKLHIASEDSGAAVAISAVNNIPHEMPSVFLTKARGTIANPTAIQMGDAIGSLVFVGHDGSGYEGTTTIHAEAAQNFTPTKRGSRMFFSTTPIDSTDNSEAMMIDHDGTIAIGLDDPWDSAHFHLETRNVIGGFFQNRGTSNKINFGLVGEGSRAINRSIGVYGVGIADQPTGDTAYGVFGQVSMTPNHLGVAVTGAIEAADPDIAIGIHGIAGQDDGGTTGRFYGGIFEARGGGQDTAYGIFINADSARKNYAVYSAAGKNVFLDSVVIGTDSAKAILDIESTNSGILIPRMTSAQRTAISPAPEGLLVYDINDTAFYYNGNNTWQKIISTNAVNDALEDDDGDTHIETEDNFDEDIIRFFTADSMHMLIDNFGNVGIGTNNPAGKFYVGVDKDAFLDSNFVVNISGQVGIGTANPFTKLHLVEQATSNIILMETHRGISPGSNALESTILQFGRTRGTAQSPTFVENGDRLGAIEFLGHNSATFGYEEVGAIRMQAVSDFNTSNGSKAEMNFYTGNGGINVLAMTIDTAQRIGIGTNAPVEDLEIEGTATVATMSLDHSTADQFSNIYFKEGGTYKASIGQYGSGHVVSSFRNDLTIANLTSSAAAGDISFVVNNNISTPDMTLTSSGNLGIGTTAPGELLQINTSGTGNGAALFTNSNTGTSSTDGLWVGYSGNSAAIWNYENTYLEFATNNQSRMAIDNNGNVGIGLTSPSELLHLRNTGNAKIFLEADSDNTTETDHPQIIFSQDGGATTGLIGYSGGTNDLTISNDISADINFNTNGSPRMTIDNFGNVGIGTTSPNTKLDILGQVTINRSGSSPNLQLNGDASGGVNVVLNRTSTSFTSHIQWHTSGTENWRLGRTNTGFEIEENTNQPRFFIENGGNIGIGQTSPVANLDISRSVNNTDPILKLYQVQTNGDVNIQLSTNLGNTFAMGIDASDGDKFKISDNTALGTNDRLVIMNNGNVGIGTAAPSRNLHLNSSASSTHFQLTTSSSGTNSNDGLQLYMLGTTGYLMNNENAQLRLGVNGTHDLTITNNGNVGIGTTSPNQKLSVNGDASKFGGGTWLTFSDKRLKKNIKEFKDGLALIRQLNPVSFYYNKISGYPTDERCVGIIAQEIQKIAPYMISSSEINGKEYLEYDGTALNYILVNAIKEQQQIIEKQEQTIDHLNSKLELQQITDENLKAEIETIKAILEQQTSTRE